MSSFVFNYTDKSGTPHPECLVTVVSCRLLSDISPENNGMAMVKVAVFHSTEAKANGGEALFGKNIQISVPYSLLKEGFIANKSIHTCFAEYLSTKTELISMEQTEE